MKVIYSGLLICCCALQILNVMDVPYETINILEDERLRQGMKAYSQWPTFPQVPNVPADIPHNVSAGDFNKMTA